MTMYNQSTQEIAKPSELLTSVRAYMTVLQSIENYVTIDITRVFNNVLLQQTQHLDSHGEPTITSLYTNCCRQRAEENDDHRSHSVFPLAGSGALRDVLSCHIPFLVSSVEDFKDHIPRETDMKVAMNVYELSSAAGLPCEIDPALVVALSSQKSGHCNNIHFPRTGLLQSPEDRTGTDKMTTRNRESVYLLLDMIVQESPFLTMDLLESCFPYVLRRNAYHAVYNRASAPTA
ncbi:hypothetical protein JOQ06_028021 [Pogonophryne albipinna]|uniref:Nck-associated protein 1 n=1 Tax=Pogonophryne albipinna TaxID=1090488 RepID=A0AAD6AFL4_9TELE|nr:hypothetical protein JOQ06_028021 [Pogonophryne albipinna]